MPGLVSRLCRAADFMRIARRDADFTRHLPEAHAEEVTSVLEIAVAEIASLRREVARLQHILYAPIARDRAHDCPRAVYHPETRAAHNHFTPDGPAPTEQTP